MGASSPLPFPLGSSKLAQHNPGGTDTPQPPLPSSKPRSLPCAVSRSHLSSALNDLHALLFSPGALLPVAVTFPSLLGLALPPPLLQSQGGCGKAEAHSWMGTWWHLHLLLGAGEGVGSAQGTSTVGQCHFFFGSTTPWSRCWNEERSWMTWSPNRRCLGHNPKPSTKL